MSIEIRAIDIVIQGKPGSPLVIHQFDDKAKQEIRDKQQKKAKKAKGERKPEEEFLAARYVNKKGEECAPITALKKCMVAAGTAMDNLTKVAIRQALFVMPTDDLSNWLVPILTPDNQPAVGVMREDAVTIGINTRGLTYRPEYTQWRLKIRIEYNPRLISREQLMELIEHAGWGVGICEGRPERTSALGWGRFDVISDTDVEKVPLGGEPHANKKAA
jgi:hypothetical protein